MAKRGKAHRAKDWKIAGHACSSSEAEEKSSKKRSKIIRSGKLAGVVQVPGFLEKLDAEQICTARSVCREWRNMLGKSATIRSLYSPVPSASSPSFIVRFRPRETSKMSMVGVETSTGRLHRYKLPERYNHMLGVTANGLMCPYDCNDFIGLGSYITDYFSVCNPVLKTAVRIPPYNLNDIVAKEIFRGMHFDPVRCVFTYLVGFFGFVGFGRGNNVLLAIYDSESNQWKNRKVPRQLNPRDLGVYSWGSFLWIDIDQKTLVGFSLDKMRFWSISLPRARSWADKKHLSNLRNPYKEISGDEWHLKGCEGCVVLVHMPFLFLSLVDLTWNEAWKLQRVTNGTFEFRKLLLGREVSKTKYKTANTDCYWMHQYDYNVDKLGWWLVSCRHGGDSYIKIFDDKGKFRYCISSSRIQPYSCPESLSLPWLEAVLPFEFNNICWPRH